MQDGHELDAGGLEVLAVLAVGAGAGYRSIGELLQLHSGGDVLRADLLFDLAAGGRATLRLPARRELLQAEVALDGAHEDFLPLVVLGVADDLAGVRDAVGQDVDVLVLGVGMTGDEVLVFRKTHALQILATDGLPLAVAEVFSGRRG